MQLDQIIIRPGKDQLIVRYSDRTGRSANLILGIPDIPTAAAVVAAATSRLPSDAENPAKPEIQQEIAVLEERVRALKQSIGAA